MKRKYKFVFAAFLALIIPAAVNYRIAAKFLNKSKRKERNDFVYNWRFGDISYKVMGKGKPLVLIHGMGVGASNFEFSQCMKRLSKYYKVYAVDLLGFGMSEKPAITYSSYLYTSLINGFLKDVVKEPAFVAASDSAADFAVMACRMKPDNFRKLLLVSPAGINVKMSNRGFLNKLIDFPLYGTFLYNIMSSKASVMRFLNAHIFYNRELADTAVINKCYDSAHTGGIGNKYAVSAFISGKLDVDITKRLKELSVPVHVLWGAENDMNSVNNIHCLKAVKPEAGFAIFDKSKLLPHYEQPLKFVKLCREFFG